MDLKNIDFDSMSLEDREELLYLLEEHDKYVKYNVWEQYEPYEFQKKFFAASKDSKRRFLCAANRIGKTFSEAYEVAVHLTGKYPEWWEGHRFKKPILLWAVGITGDSTRKVMQKELFGTITAKDTAALGTGAIPRDCIEIEEIERDGHKILTSKIKHYDSNGLFDGYSTIEFRSTQQGEHVLMGSTVDYIWLDEEDPFRSEEIYAQCVTRTATTGGLVTFTATPENGLTKVIDMFMKDTSGMLYFQNATWDDAPHLDEETKKELLASIPAWQHEMRTRGIPMMGEGLVYDVDETTITVDPFELPEHWKRVCAIDIGIAHDTAAVWSAYDAATDTIYVYDVYHAPAGVPGLHSVAINQRGPWIPVILPHDADNTERGSGQTVATYYKEAGVNVQHDTFYNPPDVTGKHNNFVEPGILEITQRMKTGRLKIFSTCGRIFEEMRRYHRKDGKIVKKFDDAVDAMRYSVLSCKNRGISQGEADMGFNSAYNDMWKDETFNRDY